MREILFRGKRVDNGEWVYGVPIKKALAGSHDGYYPKIIPECDGRHQTIYSTAIKEETLGQYTGMTDKNGNKVFEGDIISTSSKLIGAVEWNDTFAKYIVCYNQISGNWFDFEGEDCFSVALDCVIIGNVHDNPELLKNN